MRNVDLELKQMKIVRDAVNRYFDDYAQLTVFEFGDMSNSEKNHIREIGYSIMNAKLGIGFEPGSFVKSVVDNNLAGAFASGDSINQRALKFYVLMKYNLAVDINIPEETSSN